LNTENTSIANKVKDALVAEFADKYEWDVKQDEAENETCVRASAKGIPVAFGLKVSSTEDADYRIVKFVRVVKLRLTH
jgi:hypothetical protein